MSEENAVHIRESTEEKSEKVAPDRDSLARARAFAKHAQPASMRIDWFRLLVNLGKEGYSLRSISHFTGIPKTTLVGYKNGSQPAYHIGVCLLQFWSEATGHDSTEAPTISLYSFKA
jgi:hypothetical protein